MRFHVYGDGRYIDGEAAAGQTLTVYTDSTAATEATLYTTQAGAEEATNPYTVPATGIVDFWTPHPAPYAVAEGETTARPLPMLEHGAGIRFTPEGGLAVLLTNSTGSASVRGEVVHASSAGDMAVVKIVKGDPDAIGVFYESGVADGEQAWVVTSGVAYVYFVGSTTHGHLARTFVAADNDYVIGQAKSEAIPTSPFATDKHFCEIGHVLESRTGAGLARVLIHFN